MTKLELLNGGIFVQLWGKMKKVAILFNPGAGRGRAEAKRDFFQAELPIKGWDYDFFESRNEAHLCQLARQLGKEYKLLVCVGGDTTVHLVINELMKLKTRPVLGIVGVGSSNDIARHLGVSQARKWTRILKRGYPQEVDVGCVVVKGQIKRYFLGQLSLGLGVVVNQFVDDYCWKYPYLARTTALVGFWGIIAAYKRKKVPVSFEIKGDTLYFLGESILVVVSNTGYWASGCLINPQANVDDGCLEVSVYQQVNLARLARIYWLTRRGEHYRAEEVSYASAESWRIISPQPFAVQVDGELLFTPSSGEKVKELEVKVCRRALRVMGIGDIRRVF